MQEVLGAGVQHQEHKVENGATGFWRFLVGGLFDVGGWRRVRASSPGAGVVSERLGQS